MTNTTRGELITEFPSFDGISYKTSLLLPCFPFDGITIPVPLEDA